MERVPRFRRNQRSCHGNIIEKISTGPIPADRRSTPDYSERRPDMMPGLGDMHWRDDGSPDACPDPVERRWLHHALAAGAGNRNAHARLRAFATWAGRSSTSSGPSTTGCAGPQHLPFRRYHHDHRQQVPRRSPSLQEPPAEHSAVSSSSEATIADSRTRSESMGARTAHAGASQIKLTTSSGVASPFSPLEVTTTFTEASFPCRG